jgi:K319-like protein
MANRRNARVFSTWRVRLAALACLGVGMLWPSDARAQLPLLSVGSQFELNGFIQKTTLSDPTDVFSGGTITVNNHNVIVPRNVIVQMPASTFTWQELFKFAPAPYGPTQTGLALADTPQPRTTFDVFIQGNRIGDQYIAGLLFIAQHSLQTHQGFINYVDYAAGELRVGGTPGVATSGARVRLNDPIGRFGRAMSHDVRFSIDEDNPTVRAETGYPMCLPRSNPAVQDDPLCPERNRMKDATGAYLTQAMFPDPAIVSPFLPDARYMAPFEIGDYITYSGSIVDESSDSYIDAHSIMANLGFFTWPGTSPVYVTIEVLLMGAGPTTDPTLAMEAAVRTRVQGFTTDPTRPMTIFALDVDPCTGNDTPRFWGFSSVDQGPPRGAVRGRWRFRPSAPLFNLKGFPFLPPTRNVQATTDVQITRTANGLMAGQFTAPIFQFIFPENLVVGGPPVPENLELFQFLAQGSGPWYGGGPFSTALPQGIAGQLAPWPTSQVPAPAQCNAPAVTAPAARTNGNQIVASASPVTLDAQTSSDANVPARTLAYSWKQISGPAVALQNAQTVSASFLAPTVPALSPPVPLGFLVTVDNGTYASTATVIVTVNPGS